MMKRYITLCAIFATYMAFASDAANGSGFRVPLELHPLHRKILCDRMEKAGIPQHNIMSAIISNEGVKGSEASSIELRALINPINVQNLKMLVAPFIALYGATVAAGAARSLPLRYISGVCSLVGLCKTYHAWDQLKSLACVYQNSTPLSQEPLAKEDDAKLDQLFSWKRNFLRISRDRAPQKEFAPSSKLQKDSEIPLPLVEVLTPGQSAFLYFGDLYLKSYQRALDAYANKATLDVRYGEDQFKITVPICNYEPNVTSWSGDIPFLAIISSIRSIRPDIDGAYNNNKTLRFSSQKNGQSKPSFACDSKNDYEISINTYNFAADYGNTTFVVEVEDQASN